MPQMHVDISEELRRRLRVKFDHGELSVKVRDWLELQVDDVPRETIYRKVVGGKK